ncbi:MAG: NifU family protein [Bacteroidota bacterium]
METSEKKFINIYFESNPNPNSLKFVANEMLVESGESYDFPDLASAEKAPLAKELFSNFDYVDRVFYMSNFVTITKTEEKEWPEVQNELKEFIKYHLEDQKPLLSDDFIKEDVEKKEGLASDESELDQKIKFVLDEYVKPAVEQDGGAITYQSFNEGVVKVQLQGSCSGCPSSTVTLKAGIENLLKRMVPEVQSVEAESV